MAVIFQLLAFLLTSLLISPAFSQTCTSQTFSGDTQFKNCIDLPTLSAFLHYSYDSTNSTLSIAFIAPPPNPDGWVAWAINPTATGMAGSQALLAYKDSTGSVLVKLFNIASYGSITETSKLSIDVLDKKAEYINGSITIFATIGLPAGTQSINQVWQVGPSVINGAPARHAFEPANLGSKGVLNLVGSTVAAVPAQAPSAGGSGDKKSGVPAPAPSVNKSGGSTAVPAPAPSVGGDKKSGVPAPAPSVKKSGVPAPAPSVNKSDVPAPAPSVNKSGAGSKYSNNLMILVSVFMIFPLFWSRFY